MRRLKSLRKTGAALAARLLARLLHARGRHDQAARLLLRAASLAPSSFETHFLLGRCLLAAERQDEACEAFRRACQLDGMRFLQQRIPEEVLSRIASEQRWTISRRRATAPPVPSGGLVPDPAPAGSDFVDGAEFRRFQSLPPLANTLGRDVDWDHVLERLARLPLPGESREPS